MRFVSIKNLREGMIVAEDIIKEQNRLPLIKKNSILNENLICSLKKYSINGIYIDDELSKNINIESNISKSLQSKTINAIKNMQIDAVIDSAKEIVDEYLQLKNISFDKLSVNKDIYEHSLNVCEFSLAIGKKFGYNKEKLVNLAVSSLLHDIGKVCIDNNLLSKINLSNSIIKKINIDANNKNYHYYMHPAYGHNMLNNVEGINSMMKAAILEHHENEDGTGFPLGLKADEINEFARIIHVCDSYDDLISKYSPSETFEYLMGGCGSLFNQEVVKSFRECIPIYPKGITVILSNGLKAIVLENNKDNPLRPKLILEGSGQVFDLIMPILKNVTIIGIDAFDNSIEDKKTARM